MYLERALLPTLEKALAQFPAVLVTGPRQAGKTTFLLEELGEGATYLSLDEPFQRGFARTDPAGFLDQATTERVILDEIQYVPELFDYLKVRIDRERRRYGRFLLTGSQQFQLMANVSQSLAGRLAILELFPLSLLETGPEAPALEDALWTGFYPELFLEPGKRDLWLSAYLQTYVERDVRQLHNVHDLRTFEAFVQLCATRHAQELNQASLGRAAGVSQPTVKTWLSVLEAAYVLRRLPPYFKNYGKRVIKAPKIYFVDPALPAVLTRQPSPAAAVAGALGGALFEGLIVCEAYKVFALLGKRPDLYFWRSHDGLEVDLLVRLPSGLCPVEIKLTATPTARHFQTLEAFRELAGDEATAGGVLVCRVEHRQTAPRGHLVLPWQEFPAWLAAQVEG